jgi:hypothetical protein
MFVHVDSHMARTAIPVRAPTQTLYLVGDRIKSRIPHPRLLSMSELEALIESGRADGTLSSVLRLRIGQGAAADRLREARRRIESYGLARWIEMPPEHEFERASGAYTHKWQPRNIIISEPQQGADAEYVATLLADEACAEMSDHLSGKHVQGMVLIEAARQMVLAVGEKFFISALHRGERSFVTHHVEARFHDFVLPLEVEIKCRFDSIRRGAGSNFKADAAIAFHQSGTLAAAVRFAFSVLDKRFLETQETRLLERQIPAMPAPDRGITDEPLSSADPRPSCTL